MRRFLALCGLLLIAYTCARAQAASGEAWWQRETRMSSDGRLTFLEKPWWPRAQALKEGERFELDLNRDGKPDTVVTRMDGDIVEAIDDTGHATDIWNRVNTTYVISYKGSGLVDRMVSYIDARRSGKATEVELRYFRDGYLRYAWFANSFGGDAARIFALKHWQYAGNDQGSEFRGNAQIYLNKYDPATNSWQPLSECPFSFWDLDNDGRTDVTLRVSAAPLDSVHGPDTDYANNYDYMWAKEATLAEGIGALNLRLSFNIDPHPRADAVDQPHANFSFTMVGNQPYKYPGMRDTNPLRRAPQTTIHMPWSSRWSTAVNYPATSTGFSWDEARSNFRWEGQFWIYERDYLSNTGSPTQRWNMRREYTAKLTAKRELYFSTADQRLHMYGAQEGWMEAGHLVSDDDDLEFRWWSSKNDGYLDTIEVYRGGSVEPSRVAHFDPKPRPENLDPMALSRLYNGIVLPKAIHDDQSVIEALHRLVADPKAEKYERAADDATSQERKRYCLDIARELLYLRVRDLLMHKQSMDLYPNAAVDQKRFRDPAPGTKADGYTLGDTLEFWNEVRFLHRIDVAYAQGQFDAVVKMLSQVMTDGKVKSAW